MKRLVLMVAFCLVGGALLLSGCAPKNVSVPLSERIAQKSSGQTDRGTVVTENKSGVDKRRGITEQDLSGRAGGEKGKPGADEVAGQKLPLQLQDIYFEFDSYSVRQEDGALLKSLSEWLVKNPSARLTIEGNCDERGTTDYNLALGQKRAEAAKNYLSRLGVEEKRIKTVSYGKEAPLDTTHSEDGWRKNRRDHFIVQ